MKLFHKNNSVLYTVIDFLFIRLLIIIYATRVAPEPSRPQWLNTRRLHTTRLNRMNVFVSCHCIMDKYNKIKFSLRKLLNGLWAKIDFLIVCAIANYHTMISNEAQYSDTQMAISGAFQSMRSRQRDLNMQTHSLRHVSVEHEIHRAYFEPVISQQKIMDFVWFPIFCVATLARVSNWTKPSI